MKKGLLLLVLLIGLVSSAFAAEKTTTVSNGMCAISPGHYVWNCWNESNKTLSFAAYKNATCAMNGKYFERCTEKEFKGLPDVALRVPCNTILPASVPSGTKTADTVAPQVLLELKNLQVSADALERENEGFKTRIANAEQMVASLQLRLVLEQAKAKSATAALNKNATGLGSIHEVVIVVLGALGVILALSLYYVHQKVGTLRASEKVTSEEAQHFLDESKRYRKERNAALGQVKELDRTLGESAEMIGYAKKINVTPDGLLRSMVTKKWPYFIKGREFELDVVGYDEDGPIITFPDHDDFLKAVPLKEVKRGLLVCYRTMFEGTGITYEDILHLPDPG